MIQKYNQITHELEPIAPEKQIPTPMGFMKVYRVGGDIFIESSDVFGYAAEKMKDYAKDLLKLMGVAVPLKLNPNVRGRKKPTVDEPVKKSNAQPRHTCGICGKDGDSPNHSIDATGNVLHREPIQPYNT